MSQLICPICHAAFDADKECPNEKRHIIIEDPELTGWEPEGRNRWVRTKRSSDSAASKPFTAEERAEIREKVEEELRNAGPIKHYSDGFRVEVSAITEKRHLWKTKRVVIMNGDVSGGVCKEKIVTPWINARSVVVAVVLVNLLVGWWWSVRKFQEVCDGWLKAQRWNGSVDLHGKEK